MSSKNLKDLTGRRFGRWLVLHREEPKANWPKPRWSVQCDCGVIGSVYGSPLAGGRSVSCGCGPVGRPAVHGMDGTPEYKAWSSMWSRCTNPRSPSYPRYGGRGILVTPEWEEFQPFLRDMGLRPSPEHSLDRRENDGNYEQSNCRWDTKKEQANNRSSNRTVTAFGVSRNLVEWAELSGIRADTIAYRIDRWGWPVEDAVTRKVVTNKVNRSTP